MSGKNHLISVHPEELNFQVVLEKQSYCDLKIANNTEHHVAFKIKTTSPKKYFVRPNTGVIQPWDSCVITVVCMAHVQSGKLAIQWTSVMSSTRTYLSFAYEVTLQAQREYPPDMQCTDKFLLQSTIVPPNTFVDEIPQDTFNKNGEKAIEECKLRVVYTSPPPDHGNLETDEFSSSKRSLDTNSISSSSSFDDTHAVKLVKEERDAAFQQTQQLQQELDIMLKKRRNQKSNVGFSFKFVLLVGLIGIVLGFILNLSLSQPSSE
ncbi:hypothetical protein HHK36_000426 [Tetracentron sinense]|uniref:MSP domain-containing protein n=1 Tax=Tetracentron sinense TaxID=13715 RepID=A0A835A1L7_TETSI|nr:hypothetical protein HHK36_000426 [Tetracentron sinense]